MDDDAGASGDGLLDPPGKGAALRVRDSLRRHAIEQRLEVHWVHVRVEGDDQRRHFGAQQRGGASHAVADEQDMAIPFFLLELAQLALDLGDAGPRAVFGAVVPRLTGVGEEEAVAAEGLRGGDELGGGDLRDLQRAAGEGDDEGVGGGRRVEGELAPAVSLKLFEADGEERGELAKDAQEQAVLADHPPGAVVIPNQAAQGGIETCDR